MRKLTLVLLLLLLLSSCSTYNVDSPETTLVLSPTGDTGEDYLQNLLQQSIAGSYSTSPHAGQFTCTKCHSMVDGRVEKELIWVNENTKQAEPISDPGQLCGKCHAGQIRQGQNDSMEGMAHPDFNCTSCHNPHDAQASCTQSTCHTDIRNVLYASVEIPEFHPTTGDPSGHMCGGSTCHEQAKFVALAPVHHQPIHRKVPCYVCHDVSGLTVASNDTSIITVGNPEPGTSDLGVEVVSHSIGRQAQCSKCHD